MTREKTYLQCPDCKGDIIQELNTFTRLTKVKMTLDNGKNIEFLETEEMGNDLEINGHPFCTECERQFTEKELTKEG